MGKASFSRLGVGKAQRGQVLRLWAARTCEGQILTPVPTMTTCGLGPLCNAFPSHHLERDLGSVGEASALYKRQIWPISRPVGTSYWLETHLPFPNRDEEMELEAGEEILIKSQSLGRLSFTSLARRLLLFVILMK